MLETFFFAIYCYDLAPELIVNAIDCLDFSKIGKRGDEGDAALMAHELSSIASRQDIALYGVPDRADVDGGRWVLVERGSTTSLCRGNPTVDGDSMPTPWGRFRPCGPRLIEASARSRSRG